MENIKGNDEVKRMNVRYPSNIITLKYQEDGRVYVEGKDPYAFLWVYKCVDQMKEDYPNDICILEDKAKARYLESEKYKKEEAINKVAKEINDNLVYSTAAIIDGTKIEITSIGGHTWDYTEQNLREIEIESLMAWMQHNPQYETFNMGCNIAQESALEAVNICESTMRKRIKYINDTLVYSQVRLSAIGLILTIRDDKTEKSIYRYRTCGEAERMTQQHKEFLALNAMDIMERSNKRHLN